MTPPEPPAGDDAFDHFLTRPRPGNPVRGVVSSCEGGRCSSYSAGHNTHTVQATLAGTQSRQWRGAVVKEIAGLCLTLRYLRSEASVTVWHHRSLAQQTSVGEAVRVHPERGLLEIGSQWISVAFEEPE